MTAAPIPSPRETVQNAMQVLHNLVFPLIAACCSAITSAAEPGLVAERPAAGRYVETARGFMVPYKTTIPGSRIEFEMQPIPGGTFQLGSPAGEAGRKPDEGPQVEVAVAPFWMGSTEVTWGEYKRYMAMNDLFLAFQKKKVAVVRDDNKADVVTAPSNLYEPSFTYQFGEDPRQPAITVSQFAAKQYTKWLTGVTGAFYRLPTESEWEYACRAGSTTAYSFGDDPARLGDFAFFQDNADEKTQLVAQKKPNAWGLFDMHGNVAEWVLDEYNAATYEKLSGKRITAAEALVAPTKRFPRVVRGGSWDDDPAACRSAARRGSEDEVWRKRDPNIPQGPWWFTDGYGLAVGFRILRPLDAPAADQREKFWGADHPDIQFEADDKIDREGKGARGVSNDELRKALEALK